MRLGVLDIGSNTGHLLVVDAHDGAAPLPAYSHKEPLRLAEHLGHTGAVSRSGIDALAVVEQHDGPIDLIVSDVVMPEMDGPSLLGELRKRGIKARIIFVSGYAEEAFSRNLPDGEDFAFLPKPFTLKQLVEAVKGALG